MKQQINENPSKSAPIVGVDNSVFTNLAATLTEIRKLKGVTGYILSSNNAAIVDLSQKEFVTEYAMLSSEIQACSKGILKQFDLADVESVLVEGKAMKVLCMTLGENRIVVFMDKACAHSWIVKRILL
ncbi:MAG TPA: roadblock/LC7 domain-containing protein [Candidatus Acidoferrales bacterium]|nr:roadblock/LC7 domain-containing protein [Candidatus Acidoferrales bacterium]